MTKAELVNAIAIKKGYDKTTIMNVVECAMDIIKTTVAEGDTCFVDVTLEVKDSVSSGKGNFRLVDHDVFDYDFHLTGESLARGRASSSYLETMPYDLDGVLRTAGAVDAGCYQFVEIEEENGNLKTEN